MGALTDCITSAKEDLKNWAELNDYEGDPGDAIFDIADSATPIHYSTMLECAEEDFGLMMEEPEIGPAFDGKNTAINVLASCIFDRINQELWSYWRELEAEHEEFEEDRKFAYEGGYDAGYDGIEGNPYNEDDEPELFAAWAEGFQDGTDMVL